MTVAGTRSSGNAAYILAEPYGIFVDINLDLYVADSGNNRIQIFKLNEANGVTVVGDGTDIKLCRPVSVALDADGDLFIQENRGDRIIRVQINTMECKNYI